MRIPRHLIVELKERLRAPLYRNAFYLMLSSGGAAPLGFIFWIIAARFYSPEQMGVNSALIAAVTLLAAFSRLGFDIGIVRFLPAETDKQRMINACLTVVSLASLISSLVFIAGLDLWSPALSFIHSNIPFLVSFIVFTMASALLVMQSSVFVALRRAEFSLIQNLIIGALRVAMPVALVAAGALGLFLSWGIGACAAVLLPFFAFLPRLQPGYRPVPVLAKKVINDLRHFSLLNYIALTLENATIIILPLLIINIVNPEATAYFRIAWAVSSVLFIMVPSAITTSLFAEGSHEPQRLRHNVIGAGKLMVALIIPGIAILFLFGDQILLLFGRQYSENALRLMLVLTVSGIPMMVNQLYIVTRMVQMRMRPVILIQSFIAALTIGISAGLMPRMGEFAAVLGWTLSQTAVAVAIGVMMLRDRWGFWGNRPAVAGGG